MSALRSPKGHFQKGFSGNPGGRHKKREELSDLSRAELRSRLWKVVKMNQAELETLAKDPDASAFDKMLGSVVCGAVVSGCQQRAEWIFTRLVGKPKEVADDEDAAGDEELEEITVKHALRVLQEKDYATQPALPGKVEEL